MTDEENRRVRRIIAGPPPPQPPVVDTRHAERFQRALGGTRRPPPAPDRAEPPPRREGAAPASPRADQPQQAGRPRTPPPVLQVVAAAARESEDVALPVEALPMPFPPMVQWTPLPQGWDEALADTIALLCSRSDPSFNSWTILVPLDPETLPHTELRLTFSPHHLLLRFQTQSTRSLHLVSAHRDTLHDLLLQALPDSRHIDIEIT